ncbi:unnamed protein product, partial [Ectocarpus sp. 12 AP-2014]
GEVNPKHDDNWYWETALHHAAQPSGLVSGNGNAVRALLKAGADIEVKTRELARTPLHVSACSRSSTSGTIRALLEGGAEVNAEGIDGCTLLHLACAKFSVPAVDLLLRWGADDKLVDNAGKSAADNVGSWDSQDDDDSDINSI